MTSPRTTVPSARLTGLLMATTVSVLAPVRFADPLTTKMVLTSPAMVAVPSTTMTKSACSPAGIVMSPCVEMSTRPLWGMRIGRERHWHQEQHDDEHRGRDGNDPSHDLDLL